MNTKEMTMKNTTSLKQELEKDAINVFAEFATEYPKSAASLMLGLLVWLLEDLAEGQGADPNQEIVIEGGEHQRGVTIHAVSKIEE